MPIYPPALQDRIHTDGRLIRSKPLMTDRHAAKKAHIDGMRHARLLVAEVRERVARAKPGDYTADEALAHALEAISDGLAALKRLG